ncbi:hypothetical protein J7E64_03080 [Priestia megaterium]|nr:hypothetical protein [Priestia megaterium]
MDKVASINHSLNRVAFRARLRFPRAADEPPRHFRSCGALSIPLFP